jgi:predicted enzyme related to lactoylglutathione lyase
MGAGQHSPNAIRWFEIHVQDMERVKAFYEQLLWIEEGCLCRKVFR